MKKSMTFFVLFLGFTLFTLAQTDIAFHFKSNNGKIMIEEKGTFSMNIGISGLKTESEVSAFQKTISGNTIVRNFEISNTLSENGEREARLVLTSKEKEKMVEILKSANVNKLVVDDKDYAIDEFDKITADLKAKQKKSASSVSKSK